MSFSEWSNNKKKKKNNSNSNTKASSFSEYSNAKHGITEDEDDIAPVRTKSELLSKKEELEESKGTFKDFALNLLAGPFGTEKMQEKADSYTSGNKAVDREISKIDEELAKLEGKPKTNTNPSFKDLTVNSFMRGVYNSKYGKESFNQMMGQKNNKEYYADKLNEDKYSFEADDWYEMLLSGPAEQMGQWFTQYTDPKAVGGAAALAGTTALAGQLGPQVALPEEIVTVPSAALVGFKTGATTAAFEIEAGHAYNEMLEQGISPETASVLAMGAGGVIAGLDRMQLDDLVKSYKILGKFDSKKGILKQIGEYLIKRGINVATETGQEVLQEGATIGATNIGSKIEKGEWAYNTDEIVDRLIDTGKQSALTFAALGVGGDTVSHVGNKVVNRNNSKDNTLSDSEYKVVSEVAEKEIAEQEANGKKLSTKEKNKIYDDVVKRVENGSIGVETIEEILGGENYEAYKKATDENTSLKKELDELNDIKASELTGKQSDRLAELKAMNLDDTTKTDELKKKMSDDVFNLVRSDRKGQGSILLESYREVERRGQAFEADLTKYKGKQKDAVERAIKSGVLNNTNRSHELVNILSKIEADKGIIFDYTDNKKLKESGFAVEGKTVNGFVKDGGVTLNVQSPKAWETTVGHEIGHVLKGTEAYGALRTSLFEYAKSKGELETRREALTKMYEGLNTDIDEELTSDLIGDYLFNDKNFITHLTSDRNVFQKVWDEVKYLYNVATGKEKASIEKVMREFDRAWKELGKGTKEAVNDEGVKLSIGDENIKDISTGYAYGESYYTMSYMQDGKEVATLEYGEYDGTPNVKMVKVDPEYRRQGIATKLLQELQKKYPDAEIDFGMTTPDGTKLLESITYDVTDDAVVADRNKLKALQTELDELQAKLDVLYDTENLTEAQEAELHKLGDRWTEVYDAIGELVPKLRGKKATKTFVKYSVSEDSNGNELPLAVQKRFANSKAVDENGNLKVLYHGTASGEFYTFDKTKGSVEGDFGSGFYFTDSESDVEANYEDGGADFDNKVARRAEQIESEEDIDYSEAEARAREELYKGGFKHSVYLNIENPAVVGETILFDYESFAEEYDRDDYDSDEDYEADVEYAIQDKIDEIIWDIDRNIDIYSTDGIADVLWNAVNEGGIGIEQLKAQINELYLEDNNGNFVGNEVTRQIIESFGYDGIIDNTVSTKFNMNLEEGTTHYIVFKPNQIKSINNQNPTDNPDIRYSLSEDNLSEDIENFDNSWYNEIKLPFKEQERVQSEALTWHTNKRNQLITQTLSNGITYRYMIDDDGIVHIYGKEKSENIHDWKDDYGNTNTTRPDSVTEELWSGYGNNNINSSLSQDRRKPSKDDTNDNYFVSGEGRSNRTGHSKNRTNANRKPKEWKFGEDGSVEVTYSDGTKETEDIAPTKRASSADGVFFDAKKHSLSPENEAPSTVGTPLKDLYLAPTQEDIAPVKASATTNTDMFYDDYAPATAEEVEALNKESFEHITDEDAPPEVVQHNDYLPDSISIDTKSLKQLSKSLGEILPLTDKYAKADLENVIQNFSKGKISTKEALYAEVEKKFDTYYLKERYDNIEKVKQAVRMVRVNVSDNVKADFDKEDYYNFMRKHFGKIRFSKKGMSVDRVYQALSGAYPDFFPDSIWNEAEQLRRIAEVVDIPTTQSIPQPVDKGTLQYVTDFIYDSVQEYKDTVRLTNSFEAEKAPIDESLMPPVDEVAESFKAPFPDEISPMTEEEANALQAEKSNSDAELEGEPKTRKQLHNNIMNDIKATFSSGGFDFDDVLSKAKNLSTFSTVDNTPQRVMEKALGYKEGQVLSDLTVNKVAQNETEGIKWLNSFTDRKDGLLAQISKQYEIKPGSKESAAAQMYAEGFYVADNDDIIAYGDAELAQDFPNEKVRNNIKGLAKDPRIRQIYDETLDAINESRTRNAYPEIGKLDNYFLHFRAMEDTFSKLGLPFNPNDIRAKDLPTDLNGVTADLKPGQPYFASAMHRKGKRTSFDLLGGLERYLSSAKNQIYHIDDIQTLRALRNYIADTYGQAKGLESIDVLTEEEAQERIKEVYGSHLSTFAKFLNEEANVLAGKTPLIDRGLEGIIGRRGMTFFDTVNKQVGSNMVGFNVSSSLTNFIPVAQTFAKTNKFDFLKAFTQTASNKFGSIFGKGDNFAENSPVIIRRKGADRFYRTPFQKVGDAGYVLMSAVDNISTELIARTKFNELTRKGMSEQQAHFETDKWVSRLMGDRSLGQQPQMYNSKMLGIITKFQLEVRNQLDSQFYDTIQEAKVSNAEIENGLARNAKTAAKITSTFVQLAVAQHLFGKAFESIAGYNPAFDIISVLATAFGFDDDEESEDTALDNVEQGFLELLEDLPYTSTFTGGRIPISSALPIEQFVTGKDSYGNEKSRWETIGEVAPYYVLPGGYGQIKKTAQGLGMFSDEHPVTGSYTDSGNLRFPVEDTPLNRIQAGLFGQYASKNAREYFDNGYAPLKEKQIQEYQDVDLPIGDYWKYREGLSGLKTNEEKAEFINSLDIKDWQKNLLMNNILDRKEDVDMSNYDDFADWEEFDYAQKNPEKYEFFKANGISYSDYANADEDGKEAYNWAYNNPEGYALSKVVTPDVKQYKQYTKALYNIKADKDANGKSISGSRKEKVLNYINNLDADYETKLILFKSEYPSDDTYNYEIIEYINNRQNLTDDERVSIYEELGFKVKDGYVYWD